MVAGYFPNSEPLPGVVLRRRCRRDGYVPELDSTRKRGPGATLPRAGRLLSIVLVHRVRGKPKDLVRALVSAVCDEISVAGWSAVKTILVTGATSGIGAESACQLTAEGDRFVLVGRNLEKLADAARRVRCARAARGR
ncbi:SDR family NAD(P)-dependent oxidoreductase [Nocardia sp. NPDC050793]|uniref:SDR family NAD(P)-dependent oxidoreductase n=1 Tax=Nocardia sp. NPDC050793 TaxID=3155159 RepID=UPI0034084BEB